VTTRTSVETVTFRHAFTLSGAEEEQPAGRYLVETDEELLQSLSFPAYRRLATYIHLAGRPNSNETARVVDINPAELSSALARDGFAQNSSPMLTDRTATGIPATRLGAKAIVIEGWNRWLALNATDLIWTALVVGGVALAVLFTGITDRVPGLP
jgi:hypothetical protein